MATRRSAKRQFGSIRQLPSGHYQARYTAPSGAVRKAPVTFDARIDAEAWLAAERAQIIQKTWLPAAPEAPAPAPDVLFGAYAEAWLAGRDLAYRTRGDYDQILTAHILPSFARVRMTDITPAAVRDWHAKLRTRTGPTMRAHAYGLLRTILGTAVADDLIPANPCRIRGAGSARRVKQIRPATLAELETIATEVPKRYQLMVLLAAWCALRFGELAELRRADIDVKNGVVRIRRAVVTAGGQRQVKGPKSEAGARDVNIPPHLMPLVHGHLIEHTARGTDALLFPAAHGGHMAPSALFKVYRPAREAAGRPDLRFHDLRHTGAVLAAATPGTTLAELMARLGHSTVSAAMRYQHAAADRDKAIAAALSDLAAGTVTPITRAKGKRVSRAQ